MYFCKVFFGGILGETIALITDEKPFAVIALVASIAVQVPTESMIIGSLVGIIILYITGALKLKEADEVLTDGMRMMAFIGFVMISANGL